MMNSPFYWNQSSRPHYSSIAAGNPPLTISSPKVVSIPVHFIRSETTRSQPALKIQKVFRGFLVRKIVKKISGIRKEVEEIERRLSKRETLELIRKEPKERLRVTETLMALLFKLDSIRGVDSGIRDVRKAVIKKAIALQEKIDAIVAEAVVIDRRHPAVSSIDSDNAAANQMLVCQGDSADNSMESSIDFKSLSDQNQTLETEGDSADKSMESSIDCKSHSDQNQTLETEGDSADILIKSSFDCKNCSDQNQSVETEDFVAAAPDLGKTEEAKREEVEPYCVVKEIVTETRDVSEECGRKESVETTEKLGGGLIEAKKAEERENDNNRQLLERMVDDNEKMMSLMTQLFERNELQTRMLSSLTQRVQQLEKAFLCDKLLNKRTKKKGHSSDAAS